MLAAVALFAVAAVGEGQVRYLPASGISNPDGAVVYATYCASCHGEDGRGRAEARAALGRRIPDLTRISERHGEFDRCHVLSEIARAGNAGPAKDGMPCWCKFLHGMDRDPNTKLLIMRNLVRHLESLQQVPSH